MGNQESRLAKIIEPRTQSKVRRGKFRPGKRTRREGVKGSRSDEHCGDKFTSRNPDRNQWSGVGKRKAMSSLSTSSPPPIQALAAFELWSVAKQDRSTIRRARALEELIRREVSEVASFVVEELQESGLKPTWRNTLIFAAEHLRFTEPEQREKLRERLRELAATINGESHPRSRLAQEAALRRWGSLLDDKIQLRETVEFLATTYPLSVRLIALQTIQNAFDLEPPSTATYDALEPLRDELAATASYLLRVAVLERSEEDFDIGLTALESLVRLGDRRALEHVTRCGSMGRRWIVKQTGRFLQETLAAWTQAEVDSSSDAVAVVREALDLLSAIR